MSAVCPAGHTSASEDYCDVCGMPIDAAAVTPGQPPAPPDPPDHAPATIAAGPTALTGPTCPNCATVNLPDALFCENCGYDFTTGTMPRPLTPPAEAPTPDAAPGGDGSAPAAAETFDWVAEVWIDPAWYEAPGEPGPDALPRPADRRPAARPVAAGRADLQEPQHPPGGRLRVRLRGAAAARPS
jgi:hypothetical protein